MSEMKSVWIVKGGWSSNESCPDVWYSNEEEHVEGIFSTIDYAFNYILNRLAGLKDEEDWDFTMPDKEDLYMGWGFEWSDGWGGTNRFTVEEEQVDKLFHEEYKEDKCSTF